MRSKLLRFGLFSIIIFGALLSLGDNLDGVYKLGGDVVEVRSLVLSAFLVLGLACLILYFIKSIFSIIFILIIAAALFFILRFGFEHFLGKM